LSAGSVNYPALSPRPPAKSAPRTATGLFIAFAIVSVMLGVTLRWHNLHLPVHLAWDENHFVLNAVNYIDGRPDWNDHPPMGKLFIAAGILALGNTALGWRIAPYLFGLASIAAAFFLARRLFPGNPHAPWLAAGFIAIDGFFIGYSRTALLDGMVASLYLWGLYLVARARPFHVRDFFWPCLVAAVATSVKWNGVVVLAPLFLVMLHHAVLIVRAPQPAPPAPPRRRWLELLLLPLPLLLFPAVYGFIHAAGLYLTGQPAAPGDVLRENIEIMVHHRALTDMTHVATSYWYEWPLMTNPIIPHALPLPGKQIMVEAHLGNPLLWYSASLSLLVALVLLLARLPLFFRRFFALPPPANASFNNTSPDDTLPRYGFALLAWFAPVFPWMLGQRDSYIYHYIPAYGAGLVLLSGVVSAATRTRAGLVFALVFAVAALGLTIYFAPILCQYPISTEAFEQRMWLEGWR
jgi:dolichyl-phosphate-mannose--protein O-mannosyl transferase